MFHVKSYLALRFLRLLVGSRHLSISTARLSWYTLSGQKAKRDYNVRTENGGVFRPG